jgi:hypothetical protein
MCMLPFSPLATKDFSLETSGLDPAAKGSESQIEWVSNNDELIAVPWGGLHYTYEFK